MLQVINDLPLHVVGIHAYADVTKAEYKSRLTALFEGLLKTNKKINFLLVLETDIPNFISGVWCGSVEIGLKYFFKWNKVAIITDQERVLNYSHFFEYLMPGKYRKYPLDELDKAIRWVSVE